MGIKVLIEIAPYDEEALNVTQSVRFLMLN